MRKLEPDEFIDTYGYIHKKLSLGAWDLSPDAIIQFEAINNKVGEHDVDGLLAWCNEYLDVKKWHQCRGAIRAKRLRDKKKYSIEPQSKHILVSSEAHQILSEFAEKNKITLSEAIVKKFKKRKR